MPENINLNLTVGNDKMRPRPLLTLQQATDLIKSKEYPAEIEADLIKNIRKQPSNTYEKFLKNIGKYINKSQKDKHGKDGQAEK